MALALVLALNLKQKPLSDRVIAIAAGRIDAPEY